MTFPTTIVEHAADSHETRQYRMTEAAARNEAAPYASSIRADRSVKARDLHPGDVVQQSDWLLHVREITVSQATVTVGVAEFEFLLHYPADAQVHRAA
jgi:hypothetical protein